MTSNRDAVIQALLALYEKVIERDLALARLRTLKKLVENNEQTIRQSPAKITKRLSRIKGKLVLTKRRLLFKRRFFLRKDVNIELDRVLYAVNDDKKLVVGLKWKNPVCPDVGPTKAVIFEIDDTEVWKRRYTT